MGRGARKFLTRALARPRRQHRHRPTPASPGDSGKVKIGTKGKENAAFLQGVYDSAIPGPMKTAVPNASGRLGTAAAAAKRSILSAAAGRQPFAELRRQHREIRQLREEVRRRASIRCQATADLTHHKGRFR